jgi:hypothetical protein
MGKHVSTIAAIVLIALGGLWVLQGVGWVQGSFMSGDRTWLVIGAGVVAAGLILLTLSLRRGRP